MNKRITHIITTGIVVGLVGLPASAIATSATTGHSPAPGTQRCDSSQLRVSIIDREGAAGTTYWNLALRNVGRTACHMIGYPGVGLVDSNSRLINVLVQRSPVTPARFVTVRPGQQAYFTFGYPSLIGACSSHFSAYGVQIIPPNEFQRIVLRTGRFDVCTPSSAVANPQVWTIRATPHFEA
jgi:Protein of unknown function (DUF4232)